GDREIWIDHEQQFAPPGREGFAATALAGLNDDRTPLRRPGNGKRAARRKELALVIEPVNLRRIREDSIFAIEENGVLVPAVPVYEYHFHKLIGAVVAQIVLEVLRCAKIRSLRVVQGGHDIPGHASVQKQVERRKDARDMKRLVVGRRIG